MSFLTTKNEQKSAAITSVLLLLMCLIAINFGLRYFEPPLEYGVTIAYGYDEVGSTSKISETTQSEHLPKPLTENLEEKSSETIENVITNTTTETIPIPDKAKTEKKESTETKKVVEEKPKPSKETTDALNSLLNGSKNNGDQTGIDGNDTKSGDKGKIDGDINSNKYYGSSGSGDGNYNLSGRNATSKPKETPDCQEEGIVVVHIQVDRNGNVINAVAGVKGTTNNAACLLKPAKEAALKTKWNKDPDAPSIQVGTIIYKFTLTQ